VSEDYYDVVFIHDDTAFVFGRRVGGEEFYRLLTEEERERVYALTRKHEQQREALLREIADAKEV
jgi:hypothetical protein